MILTIFMVWLELAALAAFFLYCCSLVSNGPRREDSDGERAAEEPTHAAPASRGESRLRHS